MRINAVAVAALLAVIIGVVCFCAYKANAPKSYPVTTRVTVTPPASSPQSAVGQTSGTPPGYHSTGLANRASYLTPVPMATSTATPATAQAPISPSSSVSAPAPGAAGMLMGESPKLDSGATRPVRTDVSSTTSSTPPADGLPPAASSPTTYTQKTTTTAYVPETHRAYVHTTVKHHKSGKVHVGRAVKHTVEFAAKLPGRLRM